MNDDNNDNFNSGNQIEIRSSNYTEETIQNTESSSNQTISHNHTPPPLNVQKIKTGSSLKIVITTSLISLAIILLAMIIPSYELVNIVSMLALFGGPVVSLVLGIIVAKSTIKSIKNKSLAHSTEQSITKTTPAQAIIVGVLVFLGVFISYAVTFFFVALFLGIRACELSGSSKCY